MKMAGVTVSCSLLIAMVIMAFGQFSTTAPIISPLSEWTAAHATFYGDMNGTDTMNGACGYGDLFKQGYGLETTALSKALFNDGLTCGACYQIKCYNSTQWCLDETIQVTATNFCPPNGIRPNENWCDPPRQHFDLSQPMFRKIAKYEAGIVPVLYTRVPCVKQGGVKFHVEGNHDWILVLVYNVGGAGDVTEMKVKVSDNSDWMTMKRNWGQKWQAFGVFVGKGLSFQVSVSDGQMLEFDGVVPDNWQFGSDYEGKDNFHS